MIFTGRPARPAPAPTPILGTSELSDAETRVLETLIRRFAYFMDRFEQTGDERYLRIANDADARYLRFGRSHRFEAGAS